MNLMQGDCLERMAEIDDGYVDMVLCDLPYGTTQNKWDSVIPFEPLWREIWRVCKANAAVVLFSQMPFTVDVVNSCRGRFRYEWIYEKTNPGGFLNANRMPMKCHENLLVFYRHLPTYNPIRRRGFRARVDKTQGPASGSKNYGKFLTRPLYSSPDGTRCPVDIIRFSNSSYGYDTGLHPTQKPVALCEYMVKTYTNPGEAVLDMCMGSGTTGVACTNTGREFIGIERDAGYFQTAKQRIERRLAEVARDGIAEQVGMFEGGGLGDGDLFDLERLMEQGRD